MPNFRYEVILFNVDFFLTAVKRNNDRTKNEFVDIYAEVW